MTYGLMTLITALISESLLIRLYKLAMPSEKETVAMNVHGLIHVDGDKVIESSLCSWSSGFVGFGR
jgi:hypothetical protein